MTHTIQQVFNKLTAAELLIGNKHPAFAKISEAIAMLKDMQVVGVEVGARAIQKSLLSDETRLGVMHIPETKACAAAWGLTTKQEAE